MFKWYKNIKSILKNEPETWLNYLKGQKSHKLPSIHWKESRFSSTPLQVLKVPYKLLRITRFSFSSPKKEKHDFYIYAGTNNQINSLKSTINSLKAHKQLVLVTVSNRVHFTNQDIDSYNILYLGFWDLAKSLILILYFGPSLYNQLNKIHPKANKLWLSEFCSIYFYLVYFERALRKNPPNFVITANDHSIENRCLLAVAHKLKIKTVYMQHASVSDIFPALRVNYAFLDGQSALDIYNKCEQNLPDNHLNLPNPEIYLSGQKKYIQKRRSISFTERRTLGVAINALDNMDDIKTLINELYLAGYPVIIRWHPAQNKHEIAEIKETLKNFKMFNFSDPRSESINTFLSKINWLIASNSSIHLEAALADVIPIYYEITPSTRYDYYGYVKSGLALKAENLSDIYRLISSSKFISPDQKLAIRYYSSTYDTPWEGNEGDLVAKCLISIKNNTRPFINNTYLASITK